MAQLPHSPGFSSSPRTGKFKPCIARRRSQVVRQRSAKSLFLFLCCPPISGRVHAARTYALPCHELVTGVVASPLATAPKGAATVSSVFCSHVVLYLASA